MSEDNVALAFALTIGAGLSTTLGSLAPFITKMQSRRFLTASLASSAGVMLYVSFAEILDKSREYLEHDLSDSLASWYTTSSFFGGILFCWGLHKVVHEVEAFSSSDDDPSDGTQQVNSSAPSETASTANFDEADEALIGGREMHEIHVDDVRIHCSFFTPSCSMCSINQSSFIRSLSQAKNHTPYIPNQKIL
eukprot:TRINITY_DN3521_c0_g1_i6.p1 TRINITY_DN3521_c0_g1~~TRINITY_DN3521_c0_g1_i6.p1  ORF type:complete len:193 (-),score=39.57 TRINITY_DN3521_c0_g1_i6:1459-2037(-)